jgi:hypothetical protein
MFTVRRRQLKAFETAAQEDFARRLAERLRATVPGCQDWDSTRTSAEIKAGIEFGQRYKIVSERGVARLVELVIASHGAFNSNAISKPKLNALLAYRKSEDERLDQFANLPESAHATDSMSAFSARPVGSTVTACPVVQENRAKPIYWIEIQLIGEDDKPIPDVEYKIILPSGEEVGGYLDENGLARVDPIETAGICRVSFPELDKDAWEPVAASSGVPATGSVANRVR